MIQYLRSAIDYIVESKHEGLNLIAPYGHNGVHENFFYTYIKIFDSVTRGPCNSEITIYNEGISLC